jgi:enolase
MNTRSEKYEKSEKIRNRFFELLNNNDIFTDHELQIIEALFKKFELISISDYAKRIDKSYNGVQYMIKRCKIATIVISDQVFVINKMN